VGACTRANALRCAVSVEYCFSGNTPLWIKQKMAPKTALRAAQSPVVVAIAAAAATTLRSAMHAGPSVIAMEAFVTGWASFTPSAGFFAIPAYCPCH
jgi:hypothetical protein